MLEFEETLQDRLNAAGVLATEERLRQLDGRTAHPSRSVPSPSPARGNIPRITRLPYGPATVERHVYQSPHGGVTYCPLMVNARIIVSSTPKFAKMVASKYAEFGSTRIRRDLPYNHGRAVSRSLVQDVADAVAAVALAKEEDGSYRLPKMEVPPTTVALSLGWELFS